MSNSKIYPENEEDKLREAEKTTEPEKLKESAINGIKENPEKSTKMHIKHIDRNLLLAMISLRVC